MRAELNEKALDEGLAALETARPWSARVISKLESHLRSDDDKPLFRIIRSRSPPTKTFQKERRSTSSSTRQRSAFSR